MKSNQKSVRLSDRVCRYIENYRGNNFSEKLEYLVIDFEEKSDALVERWDQLNAMITEQRKELEQLRVQVEGYRRMDARLGPLLSAVLDLLPKA